MLSVLSAGNRSAARHFALLLRRLDPSFLASTSSLLDPERKLKTSSMASESVWGQKIVNLVEGGISHPHTNVNERLNLIVVFYTHAAFSRTQKNALLLPKGIEFVIVMFLLMLYLTRVINYSHYSSFVKQSPLICFLKTGPDVRL
jgi:hypothetical protein